MTDIDLSKVTPMMRHYLKTKEEYKDCILFYRLGDFYEMFFDDAVTVSKELELTLTGKSCGLPERAPMCGIPYHAVESYLNRLVEKGYKVAICEQLEDPKTAKGMVDRGVIRVVTPGTNIDAGALDEKRNSYLLSVFTSGERFGFAIADITTGLFLVGEEPDLKSFLNELYKYEPKEIICNDAFLLSGVPIDDLRERKKVSVTGLSASYFDKDRAERALLRKFHVPGLSSLDLGDFPSGTIASGALLSYLKETQKSDLDTIREVHVYRDREFLVLDGTARRNLELTETLREKEKKGTLLWVLDHTRTAMGARKLRTDINEPLRNKEKINKRLDAVEELKGKISDREEIREYLSEVYDLERLMTRISYRTANPRDLIAFRNSIGVLPGIRTLLSSFSSDLLHALNDRIDPMEDLFSLLSASLSEEPPVSVHDGGIFKTGYNKEVDELREAASGGKKWLSDLETKEREKTGIKNLRIRYNKVFGYYIEVTKSFLDKVPSRYIRKQTLVSAERFYTEELKEMENKILGAEDRLTHLENDLYLKILDRIAEATDRIQETAGAVAYLDELISLALSAERYHYCRPKINEEGRIEIKNGRHPVVERMIPEGTFVANDTLLDKGEDRVAIITGPNMAGKSTYMRQTALIVLMAQIGSFVPSDEADIGIVDRIFTRVGASDDLASGQSTFMVEMNEVSNILKNATADSLLILDEIGRGTGTYDGLSIAEAVVEYVSSDKVGAKTLFATHYHELTSLEGKLPGVHNYCSAVRENRDGIVFLRKIVSGGADRSYGIEVAKLAGLPAPVLLRARKIQEDLLAKDERASDEGTGKDRAAERGEDKPRPPHQLSLTISMPDQKLKKALLALDIDHMTPLDAMNTLSDLKRKAQEE